MSYNIRDQKWGDPTRGTESGEIEWSMDLSGGLRMASGYNMGDFTGAMQAAFDKWEDVADIDFTYVGGSGGEVDVDMALLTGSTVGRATWNGGSVINFGRIEMDTEVTWSPFGGSGGTSFYAVALHEIGHILGFDHVSDTSEIMNGYISTNDLGDGDILGAQVLYGAGDADPAPPSSGPTPGTPTLTGGDGGDDGGSGGAGAAILGLLALIAGLIFGLGTGGAAIAMAAMTEAPGDDAEPAEEEAEPEDDAEDDEVMSAKACGHDGPCDCGHDDEEPSFFTHNVYLTEDELVAAEGADWADQDHAHDHSHGACGCDGPCDCDEVGGEGSAEAVLLTDLIPVTEMLEEHGCGVEMTDDVEEDMLDFV